MQKISQYTGPAIVILAIVFAYLLFAQGNKSTVTISTTTRTTTSVAPTTTSIASTTSTTSALTTTIPQGVGCNILYTVYVGSNEMCSPFLVQLNGLGYSNANGVVPANLSIYYNGALTYGSKLLFPGQTGTYMIGNSTLVIFVNQTNDAKESYQKWAQMKISVR